MIFILWILRLIMPIVSFVGIIGIIGMVEESAETWLWVVSGVVAFLGFLLGLSSWGLTVPPRFFGSLRHSMHSKVASLHH